MTIDRDALRRSVKSDLRYGTGGDFAQDVLGLLDALTRVEAQSETRRLNIEYWRGRAAMFEAERDAARGYISELETARDSRDIVISHRDARIRAVRDVLDEHAHYGLVEADDIRRALEG